MLTLSKIFLHNWHRFSHHLIEVDESLYLAGHNGSGKSSILDALQLGLIADLQKIRFNSSAQDKSARSLDGYIRGKIGEGRYLREGNTVAYVALEFLNIESGERFTCGVCMEASPQHAPERLFFLLSSPLDEEFFCPSERPRTRRDLKTQLKLKKGAQGFEGIADYQEALLKAFGGLNERFFDLYMRALTFQPIRNIREFVEQWLLEKQPLDLDVLQNVTRRLEDLRAQTILVNEQIKHLNQIIEIQKEAKRLSSFQRDFTLLALVSRYAEAQNHRNGCHTEVKQIQQNLGEKEVELRRLTEDLELLRSQAIELEVTLQQSDVGRRQSALKAEEARLGKRLEERKKREMIFDAALEKAARSGDSLSKETPLVSGIMRLLPSCVRAFKEQESIAFSQLRGLFDELFEQGFLAQKNQGEKKAVLQYRLGEVRSRAAELERKILQLEKQRGPQFSETLVRVREVLTRRLGCDVFVLCELLEVVDGVWRDAVEAMLGPRRFSLVVPPEWFDKGVVILDELRSKERIYDVSLLNLEAISRHGRRPQSESLAVKVQVSEAAVRSYIDYVLGDIICVEKAKDLRNFARAVTSDVMVHSEFSLRAVPPKRFRPWFIGSRALQSQLEALQEELHETSQSYVALAAEISAMDESMVHIQRLVALKNQWEELVRLGDPAEDSEKLKVVIEELQNLDTTSLHDLTKTLDTVRGHLKSKSLQERLLIEEQAALKSRLSQLEKSLPELELRVITLEQEFQIAEQKHPELCKRALHSLEEKQKSSSLGEMIRNAESSAKSYETRAIKELQDLTLQAVSYNTKYQFSAVPSNVDEQKYAHELVRLGTTALPEFQSAIEEQSRNAEQELREHILHKLREQVQGARHQLERLNDSLRKLDFHGETYRFKWYPSDELHEFYQIITEARSLGTQSLIESEFYKKNRAQFERFYESLTMTPQNEVERKWQERLTDYRSYLNYDIEVTHLDGQVSRLSRILGQTSGGETQTPFYVSIAASFLQLYTQRERLGYVCPRLVVFDEAFSKMDQDRIGATLQLFHHFGLQVVTATPLERCEYLVPYMKTSLVLTGIDDDVHVEPYRNYTATVSRRFKEFVENIL